jgi:hypothetical protein
MRTGGSGKAEGFADGGWANHRQAALAAATQDSRIRDAASRLETGHGAARMGQVQRQSIRRRHDLLLGDKVLADSAVEDSRIVPDGGHDLQEVKSRLVPVVAGMIGSVDDWAFQADEQRQLRAAGTLHLAGTDVELGLIERLVEKAARGEIGRTGHQPRERQSRFVFRRHP